MLSNVYLFTGQETYLLDKELQRWKENFLQKFWSDSLFVFGVDSLDVWLLKQSIYSSGLFTTKKMIIVQWLPLEATTKMSEDTSSQLSLFVEGFIKAEGKIPEDSLLIFVSALPDKRLKLYKFLEKNATIKEFSQLKTNDLESFVLRELSGCTIDRPTIQYFLTKVGTDLYRIWFECDKLKTRTTVVQQPIIDEAMIDAIVFGQVETDSFALLKSLFVDKQKALQLVDKIQTGGIDWNHFVGMLYRAMKFYIFMIDLDASGVQSSKDIAAFLKMNPRQVKNEYAKIDMFRANKRNIESFYLGLIDLDTNIKTGKLPDTYFWLGIKQLITILI